MISFRKFLDFIAIKDKRTGKIIYPNESMKSRMYNRYKMLVKWKNSQKEKLQNPLI